MTGVFVGGVTVAVALVAAVVVGFALGRFWRRDAIARNSPARTRDDAQRTLDDAIARIRAAGKAPGMLMANKALAQRYLEAGALVVAVGVLLPGLGEGLVVTAVVLLGVRARRRRRSRRNASAER